VCCRVLSLYVTLLLKRVNKVDDVFFYDIGTYVGRGCEDVVKMVYTKVKKIGVTTVTTVTLLILRYLVFLIKQKVIIYLRTVTIPKK
jgi:hypothetical protein